MRIEFLHQWSFRSGVVDIMNISKSFVVTVFLSLMITISLIAVIYVKYQNHCLYKEIKTLEHQIHGAYRQYQEDSSVHIIRVSYDSINGFITNKNMKNAI